MKQQSIMHLRLLTTLQKIPITSQKSSQNKLDRFMRRVQKTKVSNK